MVAGGVAGVDVPITVTIAVIIISDSAVFLFFDFLAGHLLRWPRVAGFLCGADQGTRKFVLTTG